MSDFLVGSGAAAATTTEPQGEEFGTVRFRVAEVAGLQNDKDALETAGHYVMRVIDRLNLRDRYAFLREQNATDDAFTLGVASITMDTSLYIPLGLELVGSDGKVEYTLAHETWEYVRKKWAEEPANGRPRVWAVLNPFSDRKFHWWPGPDQHHVDTYTVRQTYYERLGFPTKPTDRIVAPREITALVELGSMAMFAKIKRPNQVALWASLGREFKEMLMDLRSSHERNHAQQQNWSFGPSGNEPEDISFLEAFWRG